MCHFGKQIQHQELSQTAEAADAKFLPPTNPLALKLGRKSTIGGTLRSHPCTAYPSAREQTPADSHDAKIPVCYPRTSCPASIPVDAESQTSIVCGNGDRRGCADSANHIT